MVPSLLLGSVFAETITRLLQWWQALEIYDYSVNYFINEMILIDQFLYDLYKKKKKKK